MKNKVVPIEFAKPDDSSDSEMVDGSWAQVLEKQQKHRFLTNVSRKLKTLAESALKVHILRRANTGWSEFTAEYHHHFYAYPWCFGGDIFDCLVSRGLQPNHKLLD